MAIYAISYDLNSPGQKYDRMKKAIESCGESIKPMESYWFVDSSLTAAEVSQRVRQAHDVNDLRFVQKVTAEYGGWLSQEVWNWLDQRRHKLAA